MVLALKPWRSRIAPLRAPEPERPRGGAATAVRSQLVRFTGFPRQRGHGGPRAPAREPTPGPAAAARSGSRGRPSPARQPPLGFRGAERRAERAQALCRRAEPDGMVLKRGRWERAVSAVSCGGGCGRRVRVAVLGTLSNKERTGAIPDLKPQRRSAAGAPVRDPFSSETGCFPLFFCLLCLTG